jgi:tetratricopeptide (TPR) repeat protein
MRQVEAQGLSELRSAVAAGRWTEALEALQDVGDAAHTPELLELKAEAAYGTGDFEASIGAWEDQHALLRARGDSIGAARAAAMVAMFLMIDTGLMSPVRGWLRQAEQLLEGEDEGPVHAVIAAVRTYERFMCGDLAAATEWSGRSVELGRRHGVTAAEVIGRTAGARVMILEGRVDDGLAELEAVGVLLMSGEVDPLTTGMMLCELVCAAQGLARYDIASEWTDAMDRWRQGAAFGGLHGRCRVHRAEILRVSGPCDAAEDEALGACDDLRPWMRREFGWPLAELGTIRLRKGDLAGAEEAFVAAHEHVWCPHPGLAQVRLARGEVVEAAMLIEEAIAHPFQTPSKERPPFSDLTLAPLLEAQVEIAVAAGDVGTAEAASRALRDIAERYASPWLCASASLAEARTALLTGDRESAEASSNDAISRWAALGAPFETALARMVLADTYARAGSTSQARMEWRAAAAAFEDFGARHWAAIARTRLEDDDEAEHASVRASKSVSAGVARAAQFVRNGDTRETSFAGRAVTVRDLKGYRYLARLLGDPGREFHVLDLVAVEQGTLPTGTTDLIGEADLQVADGRGLPMLDEQARDAYRRRLAEVEDDLEDALRTNDSARAELAERDRDFLVAELGRAIGLGGRLRAVGSDAERARTAVTRTLRYAIAQLTEHHPALGAHLDTGVRTGTYCSYRPDPLSAVDWSV